MNIKVVTPEGELYNETIDYVVVSSHSFGEFAIFKDHIPAVSSIDEGYIKMVRDKQEIYVVVLNGLLEYNNNLVTVISQEAHIGVSKDSALEHIKEVREARLIENRRKTVDFVTAEHELKKNIKRSGAGKV